MTTQTDGTQAFTGGYPPPAPPDLPAVPSQPARVAAAPRRTSRRGLIVSALLVLVGGLLAFAGGQVLTRHTQVLAVARDVPMGATITDSDLTVASVTKDPNLSPVPASQRAQIVGLVAQVGLVKGELLTRAQVGSGSGFGAGQQLVSLPLKEGQFPARGLTPGEKVLIVGTPGANGSAASGESSGTAKPSSMPPQGITAAVVDVSPLDKATQVSVIDVQVSEDSGVEVAQLASTGNLAVILLPTGR